jgi:cytochrome c peroxidase
MHSTFRKVFKDRKNVRYIRTVDVKGPIGAALFTLGLVFTLTLIKKSRKQDALKTDVNKLKDELKEAIKKDMEVRNNGTSIAPTLLKLSWNSSATFSRFDQSGGSCGATMRFSPECDWKSNSGLHIARNFLEPFKQKHPSLSYSDLWTLASVVAIESMDGPTIRWQPGRTDATMETLSLPIYAVTESRLPRSNGMSLEDLVANIKETFGRMGRLKYNEIVALCGAHGVGRCHADASGYDGPRTKSETKFSNQYFKVLLNETWTLKTKTKDNKVINYTNSIYLL